MRVEEVLLRTVCGRHHLQEETVWMALLNAKGDADELSCLNIVIASIILSPPEEAEKG